MTWQDKTWQEAISTDSALLTVQCALVWVLRCSCFFIQMKMTLMITIWNVEWRISSGAWRLFWQLECRRSAVEISPSALQRSGPYYMYHRVATQSILSVATRWYSMCGCALVWYGIRWYIMGGSTWWYILIAFVSSGMVECGLVKTMVWVSVLSGNTTNSYQLKAGYWMTVTIKSRFLGGVLVWHCSQGSSGIDQRILIWWHQMKIWVFIADNWTTLTSCWLSKDLTKAREMRRWGSKD